MESHTQCLTTAVGPLVIGTSSRGNVKPFFHPQTELSVKSEEGSAAIRRLKIACPHLGPSAGSLGTQCFRERPRSPAQSAVMWDEAAGPVAPGEESLKADVISVQTQLL